MRLEAVVADRNSRQKHVWRARLILATAEGWGTSEVRRRAGVSKPCVWRWQRRFMEAGVEGLLCDKTRKPGKAPVPDRVVARLIERTLADPPGETTRWTSRAMPAQSGWRSARCRRSGAPMAWRRIGGAPSSSAATRIRHQGARCGGALRRPAGARVSDILCKGEP
jgi:transposase